MSAELGPGTRVWVGWVPNEFLSNHATTDARCRYGVVEVYVGERYYDCTGLAKTWAVTIDDSEKLLAIPEPLLFPIEGGEPDEREEDEDKPTKIEESV